MYSRLEHEKSGVFLQLSMTLETHPQGQDITYTNSEAPAGQHSRDNYRTFQISQMIPKPLGFLSAQMGGREVGIVSTDGALCWDRSTRPKPVPTPGAPRLSAEPPPHAGHHSRLPALTNQILREDRLGVRGIPRGGTEPSLKL